MTFTDIYSDLYGSPTIPNPDEQVPAGEANVSYIIEMTRRLVYSSHRQELNRLTTALNATNVTVQVDFAPDGIANGTYISIDDELMFVWEVNAGGKTITVQRGMIGTTPAAHEAGALIEVNPRFPQAVIRQALKDELRSWGPRVYTTTTVELTPTNQAVDLTGVGEFHHVLRVVRSPRTGSDLWFPIRYRQLEELNVSDFGSGKALMLDETPETGTRIRVTVARPFVITDMSDNTNLQTTVGVPASMLDILPIGAGYRLMIGREVARTSTEAQGQPRFAAEVPPGHMQQTAIGLKQHRDARLAEEALRLAMRYPPSNLR